MNTHTQRPGESHTPDCVERVRSAIEQVLLLLPRSLQYPTPVLLAVSGGPDSLCMADAVLALANELGLHPTIAHLDHGLRGDDARADAAFVQAFADSRQCAAILEHVDVKTLAHECRQSIEVAARVARYRFLASAARAVGAAHIVLAHNAGDQAETVLLRLLRGTGLRGLRGMQVFSPLPAEFSAAEDITLVRPLLSVERVEIECYCAARDLSPRHDASNDEPHHLRNRVRHELLPLLESYNPGIRRVLMRLADTASTDMEIIEHATRLAYASTLVTAAPDAVTMDRLAWQQLPVGLQRATLREAIRHLKGSLTDLKYAGIEEARDVLNSDARSAEIAILADVRIRVTPHSFTCQRLI